MTLPSAGGHNHRDDERIAVEWQGQCRGRLGGYDTPEDSECVGPIAGSIDGKAAETITRRSIDDDIAELTESLDEMRLQSAGTLRRGGHTPSWWAPGADYTTGLPLAIEETFQREDTPGATEFNDRILNEAFSQVSRLGSAPGISSYAENSLVWRTALPDYDATVAVWSASGRQGIPPLPDTLNAETVSSAAMEANRVVRRADLPEETRAEFGQFVEQSLVMTLREHQYGGDIAAAPPVADAGIWDAVAGLFSESESDDPSWLAEIESPLVRTARNNFKWLYHAHIINQRMDMEQARTFTARPLDLIADEIFAGTRFANFAAYLREFADLLVRARAHQIILDFEAELEEAELEDGEDDGDFFDAQGNYTDASRDRKTRANIDRLIRERYGDPPEDDEDARIKRLAEQCFLVDHLPQLATESAERRIDYTTFIPLHGAAETIVNKLVYNPQLRHMDQLTPAEMSSLVPKIRIYKVFFNEDRTETYEQEVPFENYVGPDEISQMTNASHERGQGAGIISFDWTLDGQNPFAARRFIHAKMKLFFQSFKVFLKEFSLPAFSSSGHRRESNTSFRYIDLVNTGMVAHRSTSLSWNPDYFKLKIEVGWTASDMDVFTGDVEGKKAAIRAAKMVMFATATEHDIDVNDEGNVTLTIDYTSWQEASYSEGDSDILATDRVLDQRRQRRAQIETALAGNDDICSDELVETLEEIKADYMSGAREANYQGWQRLLNSLSAQRSPSKIYVARVPIDKMNAYYDAERRGTPTAGIEALLGHLPSTPNSQVETATAADGATAAAAAAVGNPDSDESVLANLEDLTWDTDGDFVNVQFFYFGDLVEAAFNLAFGDDYGAKLQKKLRVLMGPISLRLRSAAQGGGDDIWDDINLADIPISVHFFIEWFLGDVIGQNRTVYPAMNFIQNVLTTLIRPAITRQCKDLQNIPRQQLQLRTNFFSAAGTAAQDPISGLKNIYDRTRVDVDYAFDQTARGRGLVLPPRRGAPAYHYMLMYAISSPTRSLGGDATSDADKGIYHFGIGKNAGLLKSVKFSKADFNLREARIERELLSQATGLAILANVYSVKIKTFGNTLFVPGSRLYVNPSGILSLGSEQNSASAARMLGIGGYHTVYNVRSYIESGKYETEIDALWESSGGDEGFASLRDLSDIAACSRRVRRLTAGVDRTSPAAPSDAPASPAATTAANPSSRGAVVEE